MNTAAALRLTMRPLRNLAIRAGTERPLVRLALDGLGTWRSLFAR